VSIVTKKDSESLFIMATKNSAEDKKHSLNINGKIYSWTGAKYSINSK
jgi:hypothetical protein